MERASHITQIVAAVNNGGRNPDAQWHAYRHGGLGGQGVRTATHESMPSLRLNQRDVTSAVRVRKNRVIKPSRGKHRIGQLPPPPAPDKDPLDDLLAGGVSCFGRGLVCDTH